MTSLIISISILHHLFPYTNFNSCIDHLAITQILRSKAISASQGTGRLLELLSNYSFNLYYVKGKNLILSNFLSHIVVDESSPSDIITIPFNVK